MSDAAMPRTYRDVLRAKLAQRCERNASYSLRAFARDLTLSPSYLSEVLNGKSFLSPAICDRVVNGYLGGGQAARPAGTTSSVGSDVLSQREREVIKLIAEGYRTREIATYLSLSHKTVEKHRSNLMRKLSLRSAAAVTAYAIANGFVRP